MSIPKLNHYALPLPSELPVNKVNWQLEPNRAALLIHDVQHYFVGFYAENNPLIQQMITNIQRLRQFCNDHEIPVYFTAQPIKQGQHERGLLRDMWGDGLQDPTQQPIVPALAPAPQDVVLTKWRYSAFQKSDFEQRLRASGRDQLMIVGIYGHIGVMVTAVDAFMRDIQAFVVADAIADFSRQEHMMALQYVAGRCGKVTTVAALLGENAPDLCSPSGLRSYLLPLLDCDPADFDQDESLIDYGLDSIQVMHLIALWQQQGIRVNFIELAQTPTLQGWLALLAEKQAQP
jgi:bifunctional isochorismate lyase/aryl carrier protein